MGIPSRHQEHEEEEEYDDALFYEDIQAPKFVDLTAPDAGRPTDDASWFCLRVGKRLTAARLLLVPIRRSKSPALTRLLVRPFARRQAATRIMSRSTRTPWTGASSCGFVAFFLASPLASSVFRPGVQCESERLIEGCVMLDCLFQVMEARSPNVRLHKAIRRKNQRCVSQSQSSDRDPL
jgi:hypothetical protein